jgi:transposase-like protein
MDSDKRGVQVERLEVVAAGRRQRWSEDEKLKIVLENLQAPRQVAATARRHGVSRSLLLHSEVALSSQFRRKEGGLPSSTLCEHKSY